MKKDNWKLTNFRRRIDNCDRKTPFRAMKDAYAAAHSRTEATKTQINIYKCDICGHYHLTKKQGDYQP